MSRFFGRSIFFALVMSSFAVSHLARAQDPVGGTGTPSAEEFIIYYYLWDDEKNERGPRMTLQHMQQYVNQARCECGQKIQADIRRTSQATNTIDPSTRVESFVGINCDTAESTTNSQFALCAKLSSQTLSQYINGVTATFSAIWLTSGIDVAASNGNRNPEDAVPQSSCDNGAQGESGVWMCAQTNETPLCQSEEFFITGTQNANIIGNQAQGISFDFLPPASAPSNIQAEIGDGAVLLTWDALNLSDISGYRVLCEEAVTGEPAMPSLLEPPDLFEKPNGTVYFTRENLCGDEVENLCGDGVIEGDEQCDDGNDENTDTCLNSCVAASCGDGVVGPGEACDDGNDVDDDECSNSCTVASCGNGMVDEGEVCDDGNDQNNDECLNTCVAASCGDGFVGPEEECDAGFANADNGACTSKCKNASCGDGLLGPGETCDDGNQDNTDTCLNTCLAASCGDGFVGPGEACDDGNEVDDDECSNSCSVASCGDGMVDDGEACDDGNDNNNDACLTTCATASCGDGFVGPEEECDDANSNPNDDCDQCKRVANGNASSGILSLKWDYVCSDHIERNATSYRVSGLENGKAYNLLVVAYDKFGNPVTSGVVSNLIPQETFDFWEQCEIDGSCGKAGFCNVARSEHDVVLLSLGMMTLGMATSFLLRRRRRFQRGF